MCHCGELPPHSCWHPGPVTHARWMGGRISSSERYAITRTCALRHRMATVARERPERLNVPAVPPLDETLPPARRLAAAPVPVTPLPGGATCRAGDPPALRPYPDSRKISRSQLPRTNFSPPVRPAWGRSGRIPQDALPARRASRSAGVVARPVEANSSHQHSGRWPGHCPARGVLRRALAGFVSSPHGVSV